MSDPTSTYSVFQEAYTRIYDSLKTDYLACVAASDKKEYAASHYRRSIFERNAAIPYYTIFFSELKALYTHFFALNEREQYAIEQTMDQLPAIRELSREASTQAYAVLNFDSYYEDSLPNLYQSLLYEKVVSLQELFRQEQLISEFSDNQVIELIALWVSTQELLKEFAPSQATTKSQQIKKRPPLTMSQKVLMFHYMLSVMGIRPRNTSAISDCAYLLHALLGIQIDKLEDSELYKKLKNPLGNFSDKTTVQNLHAVRVYFENLPHAGALKLIDQDLHSYSK